MSRPREAAPLPRLRLRPAGAAPAQPRPRRPEIQPRAGDPAPALAEGSRAAILQLFEDKASATRKALLGKTDAELMAPWSLKRGDEKMFTMPKATVWRTFMMNHLVHHRGQLSVYLRQQDVPLPSFYGPSADEQS